MSDRTTLRIRQKMMMRFLLGNGDEIAPHIKGDDKVSAQDRLSIYKNAYRLRLREVIDTDHPILGIYLGDDLFDKMVDGYIDHNPSHNRSLRQFCDALPAYLKEEPFFSQHLQISELARFERLLLSAFDAEDRKIATQDDLQQLPTEEWLDLNIRFHPSLQIFTTSWNVVETWQAIKGETPPPPPLEQNNCWVLWRNNERLTEFRSITSLEQIMLHCFLRGDSLSVVADQIIEHVEEALAPQTLLSTLNLWLELGWVQQLSSGKQVTNLEAMPNKQP